MADITITASKVALVRAEEDGLHTHPAAEAITAGQAVRLDTANGKFTKSNASSAAEARTKGIALRTVATGEALTAVQRGIVDLGAALDALGYDADVFLSTTDGALADATARQNEKQTVTIGGAPTGGTFTLTFNGQTTAGIAFNAAASAVEAALELLSTIGEGNVQVTGAAGGPYTVEFVGTMGGVDQPALTGSAAGLTGGTPTITIATTAAGRSGVTVGTVVPGFASTTADKLLQVAL